MDVTRRRRAVTARLGRPLCCSWHEFKGCRPRARRPQWQYVETGRQIRWIRVPAWAKLATRGPGHSQGAFHTLTGVGDKARPLCWVVLWPKWPLVHAEDDLWVLGCSAAFFYEEPSLDQVPCTCRARWACVEQRAVRHAAVSYVKGDTYTLVILGGASFHEEDDDAPLKSSGRRAGWKKTTSLR